jgi:hypothetical protein
MTGVGVTSHHDYTRRAHLWSQLPLLRHHPNGTD